MKKTNKKLQLRVQTFEKKLQLQQVKEERITTMFEKTNDEFEQIKIERDTYLSLVINIYEQKKRRRRIPFLQAKTKEEEMNKTQTRLMDEAEKLVQFEERLENYKNKNKDRVNDTQEQ